MDGVGFVVLLYLARVPSEFRVVFGRVIGACSAAPMPQFQAPLMCRLSAVNTLAIFDSFFERGQSLCALFALYAHF
jgi:hypothetical protein